MNRLVFRAKKCGGTMRPKEYKGVYGKNISYNKKTIGKLISMVFNLKYNKFIRRSVAQPLCCSSSMFAELAG
jgi:hypothetical protein